MYHFALLQSEKVVTIKQKWNHKKERDSAHKKRPKVFFTIPNMMKAKQAAEKEPIHWFLKLLSPSHWLVRFSNLFLFSPVYDLIDY